MTSIQHEHTVSSRVRQATKLATERLGAIEYTHPGADSVTVAAAREEEAKRLRAIIHELLEALALL